MSDLGKLLALYELCPFHEHPLWKGVLSRELTLAAILRAEIQHYIRTRAGQVLRREALEQAQAGSPVIWEALLETVLEECTPPDATPNHLDLIRRLLLLGGVSEAELETAVPTPGNAAAIALYKDISARGAACHMIGAGVVEHFYSALSPRIYKVYTEHYAMTAHQAETYAIHGPMDRNHADRAFSILEDAVGLHGWSVVEMSVRDAFVATSLHYDGMLQAATEQLSYWDGQSR